MWQSVDGHSVHQLHADSAQRLPGRQGLDLETIAFNTALSVLVHAPDMALMEALLREVQDYERKTGKTVCRAGCSWCFRGCPNRFTKS